MSEKKPRDIPFYRLSNINVKPLLKDARWAVRLIWSINPSLTLTIIFLIFIRSFFPAGLAVVIRSLINALVQTLGSESKEMSSVFVWLGLSVGLTVLQTICAAANTYCTLRFNDEVNLKITSDLLTHASALDLTFFEDPDYQDVMKRVDEHTAQHLSQFVVTTSAVMTKGIQFVSLCGILIMIEPLLVAAIVPLILPYFVFRLRLARTRYQLQQNRATKRRWTSYFVTLLTDYRRIPEIKIFDLAPYFIRKFGSLLTTFRDQDRTLYKRTFIGESAFIMIATLAFYATFIRVIFRASAGILTVGDVLVYGGVASALSGLLESTVRLLNTSYEHILYISNFRKFLELSPAIDAYQGIKSGSVRGEIEVRNVVFTYPGAKQPALFDISLHIRSGEVVALVGENAAGKTTLAKVIAGLYSSDTGSILVDGIDLREWSISYLHSQMSFVFQDFGQYEATAADNIAYGNWRNLLNDRKGIERIARLTNIHQLIEAMPQGYDTLLGRFFGVYKPSGGQWQNLAVARAFAKDAAILILDEPTSNLDARTEYELFSRFRQLARRRTTILISHRFSTVSMADRIIMLDGGRIAETGTHQELLEKNGAYASLYRLHQRQMGFED